jgi:glycosyltransferase involved in cell wall biosynthesis
MKLLIFAHTPPPHHGQSYMVQLMLEGLGGDRRKRTRKIQGSPSAGKSPGAALGIECYHVNARLSQKLEDIGDFTLGKLVLLFGYCLEAIWCRFRYGVTNLYYIPAPGKYSALYRDWLVMLICRHFFKKVILHWHAAGLAKWLETVVQQPTRIFTYHFMKRVDLSIVLSRNNLGDAEKLFARQIKIVGNGVPDPCPNFEREVLPRRKARAAARRKLLAGEELTPDDLRETGGDPHIFKVLFMAHCTRAKGLFDALDAVTLANQRLANEHSPLRIHLAVAGGFLSERDRAAFEEHLLHQAREIQAHHAPSDTPGNTAPASGASDESGSLPSESDAAPAAAPHMLAPFVSFLPITYRGFVTGAEKNRLLAESDCFCFPTYHYAESFGLVLIEAMAFGLTLVATRWRSIPELLPHDYPGLVDIRAPQQIAAALPAAFTSETGLELRQRYVNSFTADRFFANLAEAFKTVEDAAPTPEPGLLSVAGPPRAG